MADDERRTLVARIFYRFFCVWAARLHDIINIKIPPLKNRVKNQQNNRQRLKPIITSVFLHSKFSHNGISANHHSGFESGHSTPDHKNV
jgi:hypothetical protein